MTKDWASTRSSMNQDAGVEGMARAAESNSLLFIFFAPHGFDPGDSVGACKRCGHGAECEYSMLGVYHLRRASILTRALLCLFPLSTEIYRCVKMRLELNRSWQQQANPFRYVPGQDLDAFDHLSPDEFCDGLFWGCKTKL